MGLLYLYSRQNINGCKLVLVEAHYDTVLISQHCKFMLVDFIYSKILTFQRYQWWWSIPRLVCCSYMALFKYNALGWHFRATTCRNLIFDMNCILWFVFFFVFYWLHLLVDILTLLRCMLSLCFLPPNIFMCFYKKWILWDFNSRWTDVQWLNRGFEMFLIISTGSLMNFDRHLICF